MLFFVCVLCLFVVGLIAQSLCLATFLCFACQATLFTRLTFGCTLIALVGCGNSHLVTSIFVGTCQHDDNLTTGSCLLKMGCHLGKGATHALLMKLRDLAAHAHLTVGTEHVDKLLQGSQQAVRRLIENHRALLVHKRGEVCGATLLLRKEPLKAEAVTRQT